jgi:hypothetical protein
MAVDWQKATQTLIDPTQPWLGSTEVTVTHNPYICFVPASGGFFSLVQYLKGTETPHVGTYGLMAPQSFDPELTDLVLRSGEPLKIKTIDTLKPNEQVVLHILGLVA